MRSGYPSSQLTLSKPPHCFDPGLQHSFAWRETCVAATAGRLADHLAEETDLAVVHL